MAQQFGQWQMVDNTSSQQSSPGVPQTSVVSHWQAVELSTSVPMNASGAPSVGTLSPQCQVQQGQWQLINGVATMSLSQNSLLPQSVQQTPQCYYQVAPPSPLQQGTQIETQQQTVMPTQQMPAAQWCSQYWNAGKSNAPTTVRLLPGCGSQGGDLRLAAVVATVCNGSSYDPVFQKVPQEGVAGTYVATYGVGGSLKQVLEAMSGKPHSAGPNLDQLLRDMGEVDPSAVVFNWECCSACTQEMFGTPEETQVTLDVMALLLQRGHMVMCSDFSLKALIRQWSTDRFGPNPFVKIGEFNGTMRLDFDSSRLAECPSAQLQRAGDLCGNGFATIKAMSGTIAYTVDSGVQRVTDAYRLEVLTVATEMAGVNLSGLPLERTCEAGGRRGAAGHVLLRYTSGGLLLVSAGHWIELVQLDGVTEEKLLRTAEAQYGQSYAASWSEHLLATPSPEVRNQMCQAFAQQMVQQSSPCIYSPLKGTK